MTGPSKTRPPDRTGHFVRERRPITERQRTARRENMRKAGIVGRQALRQVFVQLKIGTRKRWQRYTPPLRRRCRAHCRCKTYQKHGQQCRNWALPGEFVCRLHGGGAGKHGAKAWRRAMSWNGKQFVPVNKRVGDGKAAERKRARNLAKLAAKRRARGNRTDPKSVADWQRRTEAYDRHQAPQGMTRMESEFRSGRGHPKPKLPYEV